MENKTNQAGSTHICTKCQRPREVGGGCYTFCNGKNFLPIPEEKPQNIQDVVGENWAEDATQDEYETILWNYTALKNKFYPKSK